MGLVVHFLETQGGDTEGAGRWYLKAGGGAGERKGCRKESWVRERQSSDLSRGRAPCKGWAARVSHIVVQEKGDPVGGVVQEQQSLEEAGQEWSRLFHKHSQKHPGGRLEESM